MTTGYIIPYCIYCKKPLGCLDREDNICNDCDDKIKNKIKQLKKPKFNLK